KSTMSSPRRRAASFKSPTTLKTYGGSRLMRGKSMPEATRVLLRPSPENRGRCAKSSIVDRPERVKPRALAGGAIGLRRRHDRGQRAPRARGRRLRACPRRRAAAERPAARAPQLHRRLGLLRALLAPGRGARHPLLGRHPPPLRRLLAPGRGVLLARSARAPRRASRRTQHPPAPHADDLLLDLRFLRA